MKKITLLLSVFAAVFTVSCVDVTENWNEVYAKYEEGIEYHDKAYMKSRKMEVPHNVDEKNYKPMKFIFAFEQDESENRGVDAKYNLNWLSTREWKTFKREFEHSLERTKRFAAGQMMQVLADKEARKFNEDGVIYLKRLDPSKIQLFEEIVNCTPTFEVTEAISDLNFFQGGGKLKTTTTILKLICVPLHAGNNEVMEEFGSFSLQTNGTFTQRYDKYGHPKGGLIFSDTEIEALHQAQGAATIVKTINKIYSLFPVGGPIVNFDPDDGDGVAIIKASSDDGVQPEMQFVIYAMKKSDGDAAVRVPLFNATLVTLGRTGNSTLRIWRKNTSSKTAKEIIKKVFTDFNAAKRDYDFYGCSDGLGEWPSAIIDRAFTED